MIYSVILYGADPVKPDVRVYDGTEAEPSQPTPFSCWLNRIIYQHRFRQITMDIDEITTFDDFQVLWDKLRDAYPEWLLHLIQKMGAPSTESKSMVVIAFSTEGKVSRCKWLGFKRPTDESLIPGSTWDPRVASPSWRTTLDELVGEGWPVSTYVSSVLYLP